tara:strand:- start:2340 stop:3164 length:825 start_codon:yes stop_codon:yes gene_type:complete
MYNIKYDYGKNILSKNILNVNKFDNIAFCVPLSANLKNYFYDFKNKDNLNLKDIEEDIYKKFNINVNYNIIDYLINLSKKRDGKSLNKILYNDIVTGKTNKFSKFTKSEPSDNVKIIYDDKKYEKVKIELYDENKYLNKYLKVGNKFFEPKLGPGGTIDICDIKNKENVKDNVYKVLSKDEFDEIIINCGFREMEEEIGVKLKNNILELEYDNKIYNFDILKIMTHKIIKKYGKYIKIIQIFLKDNSVSEIKYLCINKKRSNDNSTCDEVTSIL